MRFTSCVPLLKCNRHRNLFAIPWKSEHQQSKCEPYIMKSSVSTLSRIVAPVHLEEMELPADLDGFHAVLKRRIRDQSEIEECREDYSAEKKVAAQRAVAARVRDLVWIGRLAPLESALTTLSLRRSVMLLARRVAFVWIAYSTGSKNGELEMSTQPS